jgi:hypothetical protein
MTQVLPLAIGDVLSPAEAKAAGEQVRAQLAASQDGKWAKLTGGLMGSRVEGALGDAVSGLNLFGVFAQGWAKLVELDAFTDPVKNPPGSTGYVLIGKLEQKLPVELDVTLALGPLKAPPVTFVLEVIARFEAVELAVRDAHIISAGGGQCLLSTLLKYGPHKLSPDFRIKTIDLPGEHRFAAPGIALSRNQGSDSNPSRRASSASA